MAYYLQFDGVDDRVTFTDPNRIDATWELEITFAVTSGSTSSNLKILEGANSGTFIQLSDGTGLSQTSIAISYRVGFSSQIQVGADWGRDGQIGDGVTNKLNIVYDGTNYISTINDNTPTVTSAANVGFRLFDRIKPSQAFNFYGLKYWADNTRTSLIHDYNPSSTGGVGLVLEDTAGGNDGSLVNFPADNSQWAFYSDGGASNSSSIDYSVSVPAFSASSTNTSPAINSSGIAFDILKPAFSGDSTVSVPIYSGDCNFDIPKPAFNGSSNNVAPSYLGDVDFDIGKPVFASSSNSIAPVYSGSSSFDVDKPQFSASSSSIAPTNGALISFGVAEPIFNSSAKNARPNNQSAINLDIAQPSFSSVGAINPPVFSSSGAFTIQAPNVDSSVLVNPPTNGALISFSASKPLFSASGSVSVPVYNSIASFEVLKPSFSIVEFIYTGDKPILQPTLRKKGRESQLRKSGTIDALRKTGIIQIV